MSYTQNEEQPPPEEEGVPEQQPAPEPEQPPLAPNVTHVGKTQEEEEAEAAEPHDEVPPAENEEPV